MAPAASGSISSSSAAASPGSSTIEVSSGEENTLVLQRANGGVRTILLNRPKALNALNLEMVKGIDKALQDFTSNPRCSVIVLRGVGRALCSGGDVLAVVNAADDPTPEKRQAALDFFKAEFALDHRIARLGQQATVSSSAHGTEDAKAALESHATPKVFVSIMDGITMGGGVGLSLHAPFRVATEKTLFAMPETGIGYFPDVGVTRCLARLDGRVGMYLGLTGARLSGEEAYLAGIATHYVPSQQIEAAVERLAHLPHTTAGDASAVNSALDEFNVDPFGPDSPKGADALNDTCLTGERRVALDYVFSQTTVEAVFTALEQLSSGGAGTQAASELKALGLSDISADVSKWAADTLATLRTKSPRSLKVTQRAVDAARAFDVDDAFRFDMRLATAFCDLSVGRDFHTGVHHTLTKDPATGKRREGTAPWKPSSLEAVTDGDVQRVFFDSPARAGLSMSVPELDIPRAPSDRAARSAGEKALKGKGPLGWEPAYNAFALPSEAECAALLAGDHPAAASSTLEPEELVDALRRLRRDKPALGSKVRDWVTRGTWRAQAQGAK